MRVRPRVPDGPTTPSVTVVVPCYNYGRFLAGCLDSILGQPGVQARALVVDDASPDGSGELAQELADADPRVSVIRHATNKGHIATYNDGLEQVDSDYVVLLSADDLLAPGALGRATALMQTQPSVGLTYGNPRVFRDAPPADASTSVRSWTVWPGSRWIHAQCRRGVSCIYSPEAVVRTSVQHQVGGYQPELPHTGDLDMWLRCAAVADVGRVNGPDQAYRRVHDLSMMNTTYAGGMVDLEGRLLAYEGFFAGPGAHVQDAAASLQTARRRIATEALDLACDALLLGRPDEPVEEYLALAQRVWPQVSELRQWREYAWRAARGSAGSPQGGPRSSSYALRREIDRKARWRRWNWAGV